MPSGVFDTVIKDVVCNLCDVELSIQTVTEWPSPLSITAKNHGKELWNQLI